MTELETLKKRIKRLETKKRALEREYKSPKDMWFGHRIGLISGKIEILKENLSQMILVNRTRELLNAK